MKFMPPSVVRRDLGNQRKGLPQRIGMPAIKDAAIDRHHQPFVRIEHQRIRALAALREPSGIPARWRLSRVGCVHVQPEAFALRDVGDGIHRDRCSRSPWFQPSRQCSRAPIPLADPAESPPREAPAACGIPRRILYGGRCDARSPASSRPCRPRNAPGQMYRGRDDGARRRRAFRAQSPRARPQPHGGVLVDAVSRIIPNHSCGKPSQCSSQRRVTISSSVHGGRRFPEGGRWR